MRATRHNRGEPTAAMPGPTVLFRVLAMTQWKLSCGWVLFAALAVQFSGCAQTSRWVSSKWNGRERDEKQVAELDGRDDAKQAEKSKDKVKVASGSESAKKRKKETLPKEDALVGKPRLKKPGEDLVAKTNPKSRAPKDPFQDEHDEPVAKKSQPRSSKSDLGTSKSPKEELAWADDMPRRKTKSVLMAEEAAEDAKEEAAEEEAEELALAEKTATQRAGEAELPADNVREASHVERNDFDEPEWARDDAVEEKDSPIADVAKPDEDQESIAEVFEQPAIETVAQKMAKLKPSQSSFLELCPAAEGDVKELVRGLDDDNLEHIRRSIHRLGKTGPDASAALPALKKLLSHEDGAVRIHAVLARCRIEGLSPEGLQTLTTELKSTDPGQRSFAAAVIAELGPQSGAAVPALAAALKDGDAYVRLHVAEVLIRHDEWSETALLTLLSCLDEQDENVRWLATYALAELAPQSDDAVDALAELLDDESAKVRIGAVYALGEIGPLSRSHALNLHRLDRDPNPEMRSAVAYALEQIEPPMETKGN